MNNIKRILIVGGVAGGASTAARARRLSESAQIIIFERGPHISFANCGLPYHISGTIAEQDALIVMTPNKMQELLDIDVRILSEVIAIDRKQQEITVKDLSNNSEYREHYDLLLLSPGAEPIRPPLPGISHPKIFTLRNIEDMLQIKQNLGQRVVIVGGGYIGLEMAEACRECGCVVAMVELLPQVMGPADPEMAEPLHAELHRHNVDLRLKTAATAFKEEHGTIAVDLSDNSTITCDSVILAIGVKPETTLAKAAGLDIGTTGGILVNNHLQTNDPKIYAVGDAIEVKDFTSGEPALIPLAGPANRQGRIAADNMFGRPSTYEGTQGTAICKVFNLSIAMTGRNEKSLRRSGNIPYDKVYVHPFNHANYYPGADRLFLKLLFNTEDGRVLGAQAVGTNGVDKCIDIIATAIRHGFTVYDLEELELCYAPPYGSAKDAINYAGFAAANILRKDTSIWHSEEISNINDGQFLLDLRTPDLFQEGTIPGAINIPFIQLRERLAEIPHDREILVFCQLGLTGYMADRILKQQGYNCRNLSGGFLAYKACLPDHNSVESEL